MINLTAGLLTVTLSKLKESDIIQILESKSSAKEISEIYNIDVSYVYKIRKKQVWKHI